MRDGMFISVEGHDGSGKTTQIEFIKKYLEEKGFQVVTTRDPGGTSVSEKIREILLNNSMNYMSELLLFAAARKQLEEEIIIPAVKAGKIVISDRWFDSTFAYQGHGRGLSHVIEDVLNLTQPLIPYHTFFLQLPLIESIDRITKRNDQTTADRFDQADLDFKTKVHQGFIEQCEKNPRRAIPIDASKSIEEVSESIRQKLDTLIIPKFQN